MDWDLGLRGLGTLVALSLAFGAVAGLLVGNGVAHRLDAMAVTALACTAVGIVVSEVVLGSSGEAQPVDRLARSGVLVAGAVTTVVVVLVMRRMSHRGAPRARGRTAGGRRA
ncbi:hypothetical protein N798_16590 [Knoellia flava TL1]|uniref:Uncharacterized protein n=2 Tax=Knoellia flava TaxID=913969 RepID=A0A8H9FSL9_9MICO|nr:hypothetical protein [Knoellia flava]KGN28933.1 hypothetical protein N798_16590 [Knoellia flava TL1]GGB71561.1 hypothetical protein GCM10011314_08670 [Knoellia flava]